MYFTEEYKEVTIRYDNYLGLVLSFHVICTSFTDYYRNMISDLQDFTLQFYVYEYIRTFNSTLILYTQLRQAIN
jgi:hypothetical protein